MQLQGRASSPLTVPAWLQDTAKTFSGSTGPKGKYQVFLEATQFDRIIQNQIESRSKLQSMLDSIQAATTELEVSLAPVSMM